MPKSNNKGKAEMNSTVGLDVPKSNEAPHTKFDHPPVQLSKHNYPRFMLGLYAWIGALPKGGADLRALVQHGLNPTDPNVEEGENVSGELSTRKAEIKTRYDRTMLTYNSLKATISALENRILDIQVEIDRDQVEAALKAQTASAAEPTTPPKRTRGTAAEAEPTQESLVRRATLSRLEATLQEQLTQRTKILDELDVLSAQLHSVERELSRADEDLKRLNKALDIRVNELRIASSATIHELLTKNTFIDTDKRNELNGDPDMCTLIETARNRNSVPEILSLLMKGVNTNKPKTEYQILTLREQFKLNRPGKQVKLAAWLRVFNLNYQDYGARGIIQDRRDELEIMKFFLDQIEYAYGYDDVIDYVDTFKLDSDNPKYRPLPANVSILSAEFKEIVFDMGRKNKVAQPVYDLSYFRTEKPKELELAVNTMTVKDTPKPSQAGNSKSTEPAKPVAPVKPRPECKYGCHDTNGPLRHYPT